ncbi:MAG: hypothetical protein AAFP00_18165, partial [Bacteroidota bacterium]
MDEQKIVELEVRVHGIDALELAKAKADQYKADGNEAAYKRALRRVKLTEEQIEKDAEETARKSAVRPETSPLFAGLTNVIINGESFEIAEGICLESIFAHVMAPYIIAFSPGEAGKPHPGPWKAASGGLGFDVKVQISLGVKARPTNFDRLNTLWWVASLLRLQHSTGIRTPVISDTCFRSAASSTSDPVFWPIELDKRGIAFDGYESDFVIPNSTLQWIRLNFKPGAELMDDTKFNLAYRALESAQRASSLAEALILIWSSIEALIRPGSKNLGHKLSLGVATYLEPNLSAR